MPEETRRAEPAAASTAGYRGARQTIIPDSVGVFAMSSRILTEVSAKSLQEILAREKSLTARFLSRTESLSHMASRFAELLPTPLHGHVRLILLEGERIVLMADSPAWKSRLRFHLPQVKRLIRAQLAPRVRKIDVRVGPCAGASTAPVKRPRISRKSSQHLKRAAGSIGDENLRRALHRLASRT